MEIVQTNKDSHAYNAFVKWRIPTSCPNMCNCKEALVWYSYRHHKYYCKGCHLVDNYDMLMVYKDKNEWLQHIKTCHKHTMEEFELPEVTDAILYQITYSNNLLKDKR
jgi:hypothetical protein